MSDKRLISKIHEELTQFNSKKKKKTHKKPPDNLTKKVGKGSESSTGGKEPGCQRRRLKRRRFNPGSGRSPGEGRGSPLQCSCLENPMDRGAWRATVHGVSESEMTEAT